MRRFFNPFGLITYIDILLVYIYEYHYLTIFLEEYVYIILMSEACV